MAMPNSSAKYFNKLEEKKMDVPSIAASEEKIAKDAPDAIAFLQRNNIDDLYEALGLGNFVRVL